MLTLPAALFPALAATLSFAAPAMPQGVRAPGQSPRTPVLFDRDCNQNGIDDRQDLASGSSTDCNGNAVPDECEVGAWILLSESFESGFPAGWTSSGSWHITDQCPRASVCDGSRYAYFGLDRTCDFNYSSLTGHLNVPVISAPPAVQSLELFYCSAYEGEGMEPYDAADVLVNGMLVDHVSPFPQLDWSVRRVDLTPFLGGPISISFRFRAMDDTFNDGLGWQVDNVRLVAFGAGEPHADCNRNGLPDECELDCNVNGLPDECDLATGSSDDCNHNGVPDDCDIAGAASADCNLNAIPDECDVSISLEAALANLELSSTVITSFFADGFDFSEGVTGVTILDGGMDMFNNGNSLNTELATLIPYTASTVVASPAFGAGSSYFTAKYDGLFVMVAVDLGIDRFQIGGFTGTGGLGTVDSLELSVNVNAEPYRIYVKRIYGTSDPSINQLIVVPGDGTGLTHTFPMDTSVGIQELSGLAGTDRIYYALVSRWANGMGLPLRPIDAQEIARELIASVPAPLSADENENGIPDECE